MAFQLTDRNPGLSDMDRMVHLYWGLSGVLFHGVQGSVLELGCNAGYTTVWLAQIIQDVDPGRDLHAFDSFQGMPEPGPYDDFLRPGNSRADRAQLERNFRLWNLPLPVVHEGWFQDTLPASRIERVAFAYLDGDFYDSILTSLEYVYPRLSPGGVIMIDDYCDLTNNPRSWDRLPGVKKACDDYFAGSPQRIEVLAGAGELSFAAIRKAR